MVLFSGVLSGKGSLHFLCDVDTLCYERVHLPRMPGDKLWWAAEGWLFGVRFSLLTSGPYLKRGRG